MSDHDVDSMDPTEMNPMECIFALAEQLGVSDLAHTHADRLWEHKVDDLWMFAINPNRTKLKTTIGTGGVSVDPLRVYIEFNGWPAAVLDLRGQGEFAAERRLAIKSLLTAQDVEALRNAKLYVAAWGEYTASTIERGRCKLALAVLDKLLAREVGR